MELKSVTLSRRLRQTGSNSNEFSSNLITTRGNWEKYQSVKFIHAGYAHEHCMKCASFPHFPGEPEHTRLALSR